MKVLNSNDPSVKGQLKRMRRKVCVTSRLSRGHNVNIKWQKKLHVLESKTGVDFPTQGTSTYPYAARKSKDILKTLLKDFCNRLDGYAKNRL